MLQKIKEFSNKREDIYVNLFTGQEGTLAEIGQTVEPSSRNNRRHNSLLTPKVRSNRKSTRGRNIYYQIVNKIIGKDKLTGKLIKESTKTVIKHVQESFSAIQRKVALLNFYERIELNKAKWYKVHPEYKCKNS